MQTLQRASRDFRSREFGLETAVDGAAGVDGLGGCSRPQMERTISMRPQVASGGS